MCSRDAFRHEGAGELMELKKQIMDVVECDDGGELTEYVGCKLDWDKQKGTLKFTQPVLLQSFKDEFDTMLDPFSYNTPKLTLYNATTLVNVVPKK
jgi:hypothetical protein